MVNFKEWTIFHISLFVTFVISGLAINLVQIVLFLTVGQLSRRLFRKINFYFNWMINAQVLFLGTWWSKSDGILYGETAEALEMLGKESGLVTMNHHYEVDWLFGWMGADNYRVLGNSRVFVKKMLAYVPVVGWSWLMSDVVFLARDWEKDKLKLADGVRQLGDYPDPMWLLLFAEGTRLSPEKLTASKEFAIQRNLPVLKHHLVPRTKGFVAAMSSLDKTKVTAIYDVTLAMPADDVATVSTLLVGKKAVGHMYVRRFDINTLPADEKGLQAFLMKLYTEKDELKENFLKTGSFTSGDKYPIHSAVQLERRLPVLINTLVLNFVISFPLATRIGHMVVSGSAFQMTIAATIIAGLYFLLRKFINLTKISKASTYGKKAD